MIPNIISSVYNSSFFCEREKIIIEILQIYNCRISEVLNAKFSNFKPQKRLVLIGLKKSDNIIVLDRLILKRIEELPKLDSEFIFYPTTYRRMYTLIKTNFSHIFARFRTGKNHKVTHGFRYLNCEDIDDVETIRTLLHHKSKKSQKYYKQKGFLKGKRITGLKKKIKNSV